MQNLITLEFECNQIGDEGVQHLNELLQYNKVRTFVFQYDLY